MTKDIDRSQILTQLRTLSVRIAAPGDPLFKLKSGEESRYYFDVKQTSLHRRSHATLARMLYAEFSRFQGPHGDTPAGAAGVVLGGCHLASIVALEAFYNHDNRVDVINVRPEPKDHGTKRRVEAPPPAPYGKFVALFEDVITTGGSSLSAIKALEEDGYIVVGIVAVIDRRVVPTEDIGGYPLRALFTLKDFEDLAL